MAVDNGARDLPLLEASSHEPTIEVLRGAVVKLVNAFTEFEDVDLGCAPARELAFELHEFSGERALIREADELAELTFGRFRQFSHGRRCGEATAIADNGERARMNSERNQLDFDLSAASRDAMRRFPDAVERVDEFGNPVFTIAPRVPEFGPLVVELCPGSGVTLSIGFFTHTHFDGDVSDAAPPRDLAEQVVGRIVDVMADQIVAYGSPLGGGTLTRGDRPSRFSRWLSDGRCWLWSGPVALEHLDADGSAE